MKSINIEILMSHSIGISDSYYRATETELLDDYLKIKDSLTISKENRRQVDLSNQYNQSIRKDKDEIIALRKELEPLITLRDTLIREGILKDTTTD